ncbi:MAG: cytochrome-ba3 oxidase subunit [Salinirussus sp.]
MDLSPRFVAAVGLVALVPAATYVALTRDLLAAVTLVNVVLIVGSLLVALSPTDHADGARN